MGFIIGILTFVLVVDCLLLVLLVLIQLPKKEAGAGLAFGAGASDALFGAGSGTVLTKITRWAATAFFILAVGLGMLQKSSSGRSASSFQKQLEQPGRPPITALPGPSAPASQPVLPPAGTPVPLTGSNLLLTPQPEAPATNAAPATPAPSTTTATNTASPK